MDSAHAAIQSGALAGLEPVLVRLTGQAVSPEQKARASAALGRFYARTGDDWKAGHCLLRCGSWLANSASSADPIPLTRLSVQLVELYLHAAQQARRRP